jgi:hypothetical protein
LVLGVEAGVYYLNDGWGAATETLRVGLCCDQDAELADLGEEGGYEFLVEVSAETFYIVASLSLAWGVVAVVVCEAQQLWIAPALKQCYFRTV